MARSPPAGRLATCLGNPPGTFLNVTSTAADPMDLVLSRWADGLRSHGDLQAVRTYWRLERWTLDESPMARRLYEEVTELLYRENRFMGGRLIVSGRAAHAGNIHAPVPAVADRTSLLVPPGAVLPFQQAVGSRDARVLWREQERGVALQRVGGLVGRWAHERRWPQIVAWTPGRRRQPVG